jgi:transposase
MRSVRNLLTSADVYLAKNLRTQGLSWTAIGKRLGVNRGVIERKVLSEGVVRIGRTTKLTPSQESDLLRDWVAGESGKALSKKYGVSKPVVSRIVSDGRIQGIVRPQSVRRSKLNSKTQTKAT